MEPDPAAPAPAPGGPAPTAPENRFPPGLPYIVGNEAAERFSFYGMRQILYIYLVGLFTGFVSESQVPAGALDQAKVHATQLTHLFNAGVYLFPMIGAILADRLLGKYRVIFWVSLLYVAGHGALALAGRAGALGHLGGATFATYLGLAFIALGAGGIKPCVSANVGDQFTATNAHLVTQVFQIFYFIINFGSFFASLLIPILYQNFGAELAFGVPGVLMAVAAIVFWAGRRKFVQVPPQPGGGLGLLDFTSSSLLAVPLLLFVLGGPTATEGVVRAAMSASAGAVPTAIATFFSDQWPWLAGATAAFVAGSVLFSLRQKMQADSGLLSLLLHSVRERRSRKPGEDFWAPARKRFGAEAAEGPPAVGRIVVVFSMVSVFWALFDQHSSTWIEQAKGMALDFIVPDRLAWWVTWIGLPGAAFGGLAALLLRVANVPVPRGIIAVAASALAASVLPFLWWQLQGGSMVALHLLPSQIAALNPLLVMIIIPLLSLLVYNPLERRGRPLAPLARMTIGMFLGALSFVAVALLQQWIQLLGPGRVSVLWQIVPFTLLTTAEVMVSVTGLEFAYTQAPRAMKSTVMGFWMLCISLGNVLVAFLAPLETLSLATFFWTFAGLMAVAAALFALLAARYRGKTYLQQAG